MQLGRENDIDSFASRVSALRERVNTPETSKSKIDVMLATLKDDVQAAEPPLEQGREALLENSRLPSQGRNPDD